MKYLFLSLISTFLIFGCNLPFLKQNDQSMDGTWQLADVVSGEKNLSFDEQADLTSVVTDGYHLFLFKDGSFSEIKNLDEYQSGTWQFRNEVLIRTYDSAKSFELKESMQFILRKKEKPRLTITLNKTGNEYLFTKQALSLLNEQEDPFYPSNNAWRIMPAKPETDKQIKDRLTNYIKHVALILKAAKERETEIISFELSAGPIKIYQGGIGLYDFEKVSESWKAVFYHTDEAQKAYTMFENYLKKSHFEGASTGNWVEDDLNILQGIYAGMIKE